MIDALVSWLHSRGGSQSNSGDDPEWDRLKSQLDAAMPEIEAGKAWLEQAAASVPAGQNFLHIHRDQILLVVPALRQGLTNSWMDLVDEPAWRDRLQPRPIVALLGALQVWQIAAAERGLKRQGILVGDLDGLLSAPLLEETATYLHSQEAIDEVIADLRTQTRGANHLYPLAVDACEPEETEPASELISATSRFSQTEDLEGFSGGMANTWKMMDVSTIALLYRGFGSQQDVGRLS